MTQTAALLSEETGSPRRYRNPLDGQWVVQIMQGDFYVTDSPDEVLTTILGSCVAACIRDPVAGVGGMNHFLLPEGSGADSGAQRFGVNAMEMLINGILSRGGDRRRLEAKLFGGANVMAGLSNVGTHNADFARRFLEDEGIYLVGEDVGGTAPRRIQFWPASGRARRLAVSVDAQQLAEQELQDAKAASPDTASVELF
jgi:chemotaxis protein CheD